MPPWRLFQRIDSLVCSRRARFECSWQHKIFGYKLSVHSSSDTNRMEIPESFYALLVIKHLQFKNARNQSRMKIQSKASARADYGKGYASFILHYTVKHSYMIIILSRQWKSWLTELWDVGKLNSGLRRNHLAALILKVESFFFFLRGASFVQDPNLLNFCLYLNCFCSYFIAFVFFLVLSVSSFPFVCTFLLKSVHFSFCSDPFCCIVFHYQ